jgi:hypothetical protein
MTSTAPARASYPVPQHTPSPTWQEHLVTGARRHARSRTQDWPGTPTSHIPLATLVDLDQILFDGRAVIVHRPSRTRPDRTVSYLVATHSQ